MSPGMALLKSTIALFPDLPICWDEGRVKGRIWCPLNPLGEPEATWREWPINPDHPVSLHYCHYMQWLLMNRN